MKQQWLIATKVQQLPKKVSLSPDSGGFLAAAISRDWQATIQTGRAMSLAVSSLR
jgi:predicted DNA-binding transcriptional regulator AlpA